MSGVRVPAPAPFLKDIVTHVADTLRQRVMLPRGARVLAAVSGGSDSVALALVLAALHDRGVLAFAGIAHFNHQLRGADAEADERFCAELAQALGVPFDAGRADVAALAHEHRASIESAARRARYAWLAESAARLDAAFVATGHTLDDQAETVLMRLLRGTGARGISGVRAVRAGVIRPLIDCRRAALRDFLAARGQTFRDDASNLDLSITRNRLRHELMPVVERLAPGAMEALARTARLAEADEDFLEREAVAAARFIVLTTHEGAAIDARALRALAPAIRRRVLRRAVSEAAGHDVSALTSAHVEALDRLAQTTEAARTDLPGLTALSENGHVTLRRSGAAPAEEDAVEFEYVLEAPGAVAVPEAGIVISAERLDRSPAAGVEENRGRGSLEFAVEDRSITWPIAVRNRRPGDRIKPLGAAGRKKVQDLLVDAKVPRSRRGAVPVVVDAAGRLLWVVGVAPADGFRAVSPRAKVVVFRAKRQ